MGDQDEVLAALNAAGTELVMMPSGVEYQIEQTPVLEMVRSGLLTGALRAVALKIAGEGLDQNALQPGEQAAWDELQRAMICRWVRGFAWTCSCEPCVSRRAKAKLEPMELRPWKLTPEILAADPPQISRVDLAALSDMVLYLRTPRQIDALSRVAHEQMSADEALAVEREEVPRTVAGWSSFRGLGAGARVGVRGEVLGDDAGGADRPNRAARRAAAQRRPRRAPTAGRRERSPRAS